MSTSQNANLLDDDHLTTPPRKRTADHLTDPDEFLAVYFEERGIDSDLTSSITRSIDRRAEQARERFKRIRTSTPIPAADTKSEMLTPEQKYTRRLVNNRKSSAASRVHREVLKAERAFALNQLFQKTNEYEAKVQALTHKLDTAEENVTQLRLENARLQGQQQNVNINNMMQPSLNKPPRARAASSRRTSSVLSPLNTNLGPVSTNNPVSAPVPSAPYNMVPLTPKTAERVITNALKLEDSVVKGVMNLDKQGPGELSGGSEPLPFQDFGSTNCGDTSPNSRRNEVLASSDQFFSGRFLQEVTSNCAV